MSTTELPGLRRFDGVAPGLRQRVFHLQPEPIRTYADARGVGDALGAVLYTPATSARAGERLLARHWPGLTATVLCLEDAIADRDLADAERAVTELLRELRAHTQEAGTRDHLPFVFVRPRSPEHAETLLGRWGELANEVDGLVLPKVGAGLARAHFALIASAQHGRDRPLWAMPIVEGIDVALRETRLEALLELRAAIAGNRELVPCVRIGATDLSGQWGLRRTRELTIYDIAVVRDIIADVVNVIGREDGPAISGPVWEYLREGGPAGAFDGLVRETQLDGANGLHGKTVIHPTHAPVVDALHAVSHEDYVSAVAIDSAVVTGEGIVRVQGGARMDEAKPHARWAERTLRRAAAFGVLQPGRTYLDLLDAAGD